MDEHAIASEDERRKRAQRPLLAIWLTWLLGPATLLASMIFCRARPELCDKDLCLGILLIVTHWAAGGVTLLMLLLPGQYRRTPEFWILFLYWIPLLPIPLMLIDQLPQSWHALIRPCMLVAAALAASLPVAGAFRAFRRLACRFARGEH